MNLVASLICRNEMSRYLPLVIPALSVFCDEIRVLDDASDDGTYEWLLGEERVTVARNAEPVWMQNEGIARQQLFEWTLEAKPTHILCIDADEFVSDGCALRDRVVDGDDVPVWCLLVCEVWLATESRLWLRNDGGWAPSYSPVLFRAPESTDARWRIPPRKLACGREPYAVVEQARDGYAVNMPFDLLHFGWADDRTRKVRYERYAAEDGGQYHSSSHLDSIMWEDGVQLEEVAWPAALPRDPILRVLGG